MFILWDVMFLGYIEIIELVQLLEGAFSSGISHHNNSMNQQIS